MIEQHREQLIRALLVYQELYGEPELAALLLAFANFMNKRRTEEVSNV